MKVGTKIRCVDNDGMSASKNLCLDEIYTVSSFVSPPEKSPDNAMVILVELPSRPFLANRFEVVE